MFCMHRRLQDGTPYFLSAALFIQGVMTLLSLHLAVPKSHAATLIQFS